MLIELFLRYLS